MSIAPDFHLPDLEHMHHVRQARHGNLAPLIALLRSDAPLSRTARDYLADELEQKPRMRFARRSRKILKLRQEDRKLLFRVRDAKLWLTFLQLGEGTEDQRLVHAIDNWPLISDERALDHLAEHGIEADRDKLRNARVRYGVGPLNPESPKKAEA